MGVGTSTRRGGGRKVLSLPQKSVFLGFRGRELGMSQESCRDGPAKVRGRAKCLQKFCLPSEKKHSSVTKSCGGVSGHI